MDKRRRWQKTGAFISSAPVKSRAASTTARLVPIYGRYRDFAGLIGEGTANAWSAQRENLRCRASDSGNTSSRPGELTGQWTSHR